MTIVYILLVINYMLGAYIVMVINEVDKRNHEHANLITANQRKTDEKIIELRERLEEFMKNIFNLWK